MRPFISKRVSKLRLSIDKNLKKSYNYCINKCNDGKKSQAFLKESEIGVFRAENFAGKADFEPSPSKVAMSPSQFCVTDKALF